MSYPDEKEYDLPSYTGTFDKTIDAPQEIEIDGLKLYGIKKIHMCVDYYYVQNAKGEMDLDISAVTFYDIFDIEVAETDKLTDKQLIALGFPYDELLNKAAQEAE